jgi:membrane-bound lytic murein transglycosylase B
MKKLISALLCLCLMDAAIAADLPGIPEFIDEMVAKHQFRRAELNELFTRAEHRPEIIEAITKPATLKPWPEYRAAFVNAKRVKLGVAFWDKHQRTLQRAEQEYGVPAEIMVAIIGVETIYGKTRARFVP